MTYATTHKGIGMKTGARTTRTYALDSLGSVVYAARFTDGTIKIGYSRKLGRRLWDLTERYGMKSELLAFRPGGYDEEQAIHATLVEHRSVGRECYHPTTEVLSVVNDMRESLNLPHVAA